MLEKQLQEAKEAEKAIENKILSEP